ncbi:hypothetical protein BH09SUM1_BH09SUM1_33610 [soil metagenome]
MRKLIVTLAAVMLAAVLLAIGVVVFAIVEYRRDPYGWLYTRNKPNPSDLVGVYTPVAKSLAFIKDEGHYKPRPASIALFADGTMTISNIPDWWNNGWGTSGGGFDSGTCTWKLNQDKWRCNLWINFSKTDQFDSLKREHKPFNGEMELTGQKPPYKIYLIVGDPDSDEGIWFEKQEMPE